MEEGTRNVITNSKTGSPIKKIRSSSESFGLVGGWHVCVNKKSGIYSSKCEGHVRPFWARCRDMRGVGECHVRIRG